MTLTRREFGRITALTAAGIALVGPDVFADVEGQQVEPGTFSWPVTDHSPANDGPAPQWEGFRWVIKDPASWRMSADPLTGEMSPYRPKGNQASTIGYCGTLMGSQYGEWIHITDVLTPEIISEVKVLLCEQVNSVRHKLIKDAGHACFCAECKVAQIVALDESLSNDQEFEQRKAIVDYQGPTHGFRPFTPAD